jgi:hypothetical protein
MSYEMPSLTHREFQLKLVGRHVVQRRMEAFGIIHILQKRLQARLSFLKGLILVQIYLLTLYCLLQNFPQRRSQLAAQEWTY